MTEISIVSTMYHSEKYVKEFYDRALKVVRRLGIDDYEFVFVNDGSPDNSLKEAVQLHKQDARVKVIELSRNFGHHKAIMTGLSHASGNYVFLIDIDLEEEPELLESFWNKIHEDKDVDVVYGVQEKRKGGWFERWSGAWFYEVFNWLSGTPIPKNMIIARLMTGQYKQALVEHKDQSVFLFGIGTLAGFNQVPIICHKKHKGSTTYNINRKIALAVNSITAFSSKPLHYIFYLGFIISALSVLYVVYLIVNKLFFASPINGWTSLIISIYMLGGLILASIGVIGIYISKIFDEVKNRPYTIIKKIHGITKDA